MHVDIEGATRIARLAAEFDWSWAVDDLEPFLRTSWIIEHCVWLCFRSCSASVKSRNSCLNRCPGQPLDDPAVVRHVQAGLRKPIASTAVPAR